jgi:8-oxo-dGTP pyrophosphatase MutT (NUDIX family)
LLRRELRLSLTDLSQRLASRRFPAPSRHESPAHPRAAVAVILARNPESVLLIRRAERADDPWSGDIGLPGGHPSTADADLLETAMRETTEEVGIELERRQYLGLLDQVSPRSPYAHLVVVQPYVFLLPDRPGLTLSEEVAEAFWVDLAELRDPAIQREMLIDLRGQQLTFPAYHLTHGVVWGLTERILTPLLALV